MHRHISVCAVPSQAACILSRLGHMGEGARAAAERRVVAKSLEAASNKDLVAHWNANIRGHNIVRVG